VAGLNKMLVIGNVGTDPELRYTPNGNPVTTFRLATSRSYNSPDGERRQETEWFTVVAWNQLAEQCNQYLAKGRRAYVEGRLKSNTWQGQDGQSRFSNEISASRIIFLDRLSAQDGSGEPTGDPSVRESFDVEDLPF
jgi:single-strand DNA-binding protein